MSYSSPGIGYGGNMIWFDHEREMHRLRREVDALTEQLEEMRATRTRELGEAYEHGLRDTAKVHRDNQMLAAVVAALTDRNHPLNVRT